METENIRRVVVNHGAYWDRPNKDLLKDLTKALPDAKIHGFGIYNGGFLGLAQYWYLLIESTTFNTPWGQAIVNITTAQILSKHYQKTSSAESPQPD